MLSVLFATVLAIPPAPAVQPNWPQFRGPNRDGFSAETGLLTSWPAPAGPPRKWVTTGLGGGYSSVAIVGDTVYGTGLKSDGEYLWALDAATGKVKWSVQFAPKQSVGYGDGPRGTPTVADGRIYVVGTGGTLACFDAGGKPVWSRDYVKEFGAPLPGWGFSESVLVRAGKVYGSPGSKSAAMVALDAATGKTLWQLEVKDVGSGGGYASPVFAELGGVPMVLNVLGNKAGLVAVHADTGKLLWQYAKVVNPTASIPSPVIQGDKVFVSTGYDAGGAALLQMKVEGEQVTVAELKRYKAKELQNHHGGLTVVGKYIYFGAAHNQGRPACVEFATGKIVYQEEAAAGKFEPSAAATDAEKKFAALRGDGSAAVIAAEGHLYFRYQNGLIVLAKATPTEFTFVSKFMIPDPSGKASWPHPALAGKTLYLRDQDKLHAFDVGAK